MSFSSFFEAPPWRGARTGVCSENRNARPKVTRSKLRCRAEYSSFFPFGCLTRACLPRDQTDGGEVLRAVAEGGGNDLAGGSGSWPGVFGYGFADRLED